MKENPKSKSGTKNISLSLLHILSPLSWRVMLLLQHNIRHLHRNREAFEGNKETFPILATSELWNQRTPVYVCANSRRRLSEGKPREKAGIYPIRNANFRLLARNENIKKDGQESGIQGLAPGELLRISVLACSETIEFHACVKYSLRNVSTHSYNPMKDNQLLTVFL